MTEAEAFKYLENWRWPDGKPKCPVCASEAYILFSRPGKYRCKDNAHDFTATTRSVFRYRKKSPQKCVEAIEIVKRNPAIAPVEFMKLSGWTYHAAWYFLDRIKEEA